MPSLVISFESVAPAQKCALLHLKPHPTVTSQCTDTHVHHCSKVRRLNHRRAAKTRFLAAVKLQKCLPELQESVALTVSKMYAPFFLLSFQ